MGTLKSISASFSYFARVSITLIALVPLIQGCASTDITTETVSLSGDPSAKKSIFVFLDGTRNDPGTETNVWKLYRLVAEAANPQTIALYVEGVGSAADAPLTGMALGRGMETRILKGYSFISEHYRPGDQIFLFGFSRGAHQVRALAGLISYAGLLQEQGVDSGERYDSANRIIELTKKQRDDDFEGYWKSWRVGQPPPLAAVIRDKLGLRVVSATIAFMGVWDTVPGSSLKSYYVCKEKIGFLKKYGGRWIPGIDNGERYKSDSYPPLKNIAHAVSMDEKRSKFRPLLICPPMQPSTIVDEVWFPGAHADVGGGYEDSDELPRISLQWMAASLGKHYSIDVESIGEGNPLGLAHWSIGDRPANLGSHCEDRIPDSTAKMDPSIDQRKSASTVLVRWYEDPRPLPYPIDCQQAEALAVGS